LHGNILDRYWAEISRNSKEDKWQHYQRKRSGRQPRPCPGTGLRDCRKGRKRIRRILRHLLRLLDRILAADPEQERCGRDRRLFSSCLVFPWFYFPFSSSSTMLSASFILFLPPLSEMGREPCFQISSLLVSPSPSQPCLRASSGKSDSRVGCLDVAYWRWRGVLSITIVPKVPALLTRMLVMDNASRRNRSHQHHISLGRNKSGYEPSDTESEWQESPWHDGISGSSRPTTLDHARIVTPLNHNQTRFLKEDNSRDLVKVSRVNPSSRSHSRSPYKAVRGAGDGNTSEVGSGSRKNTSPLKISDNHRRVSTYNIIHEESNNLNGELHSPVPERNHRTLSKSHKSGNNNVHSQFELVSKVSGSSYSRNRSKSAPKPQRMEEELQVSTGPTVGNAGQILSPLVKTMIHNQMDHADASDSSILDIRDMISRNKLSKSPSYDAYELKSTDSISPGNIFFSQNRLVPQKNFAMDKGNNAESFAQNLQVISEGNITVHQDSRGTGCSGQTQGISVRNVLSRTNTSSSSAICHSSSGRTNTIFVSANSRLNNGGISSRSSKFSDDSGKLDGGIMKFSIIRQKNQTDAWFSCVKGVSCRKSKPPEQTTIDEASLIEKAFVVEELRQFWADKHRPKSLDGFICHKHQAHHLKELVSCNKCPHILFKGPMGSGKKSLCMALLHELFGDSASKTEAFDILISPQGSSPMQIVVPLTSSAYHLELNLKSLAKNARHALMAIVKEITENYVDTSEFSDASFKTDFKVIVLYEVNKVTENVQNLIKWIMECYTHACKIIICCEDDADILDCIKNRCELIYVDAPVTHEIKEVLFQIAMNEGFELPAKFATGVATKCKQNLRKAIMALEACKVHNYPFIDGQPIPIGWEEVLVEIAAEILADPSPKRLVSTRGKLQKLLVEFVHPRLILQKLVEQFLKGIEARLKRGLYYWHAYYDKRLPVGTSALLKLEEFIAKFMSMHRKSFSKPLYI
ncbi:unnamed protein product, partial [Musa acuminata var. zebrina]